MHTHNQQINKDPTGNSTSDMQWDNMQHSTSNNISQERITVHNGKRDNKNDKQLCSSIEEPNENSTTQWEMEG